MPDCSGTVGFVGGFGATGAVSFLSELLEESEEIRLFKISPFAEFSFSPSVLLLALGDKKEFKSLKMPNLSIKFTS